jgi:hypothetical protein
MASSSRGSEGICREPGTISDCLRQRLGDAGTVALDEMFDTCRDDVVKVATDQFERRFNHECNALRGAIAELRGGLRGEIAELRSELRGEMTALKTELRGDMQELRVEMRTEMKELRAEMRTEMKELRVEMRSDFRVELANARADLLKWSFVFWAGQMAATVAVMVALR